MTLVYDGSLGGKKCSEITFGVGTEDVTIKQIQALNDPTTGGKNEIKLFISNDWTGTVLVDHLASGISGTGIYQDFDDIPPII